jgi:hypothetical protein
VSQINTNGINVNYPVPGENNSSQGFRDNFGQITTNLNTAATEITDLQNKVVLKAALDNSVLNNDMANAQISNCSTRGFRGTTFNLGNALAGTVLVDVNKADVHYGTVTGNVTLQFGSWAPTNTESEVTLRLAVANANAVISLPSQVVSSNNNFGTTLLENYTMIGNTATITAPANTQVLEFTFTSLDCGNTISVAPTNRPFQSTEIQTRNIPPTGLPGDVNGTIAVGPSLSQIEIASTNAADYLTTGNTSQLYPDLPVVFTGTSMEANIVTGSTYYVRNVVSTTQFTIATSIGGGNVNLAGNASSTAAMYGNPTSYLYVSTGNYDSTFEPKTLINSNADGNLTLSGTGNLVVNAPIIFTGNVDTANTNLVANAVYYIKNIATPNITISQSRVNGIAGTEFVPITKTNANISATAIIGTDIWKQIPLLPDVDTTSNLSAANVVISDNLTVGGNAVINGNLTVNGTYTYENVSTLAVEDPIIGLGRGANNAALSSDDNKDRGTQLWYYSGSEKSAFIGWDDSQQKLVAATDVTITDEVVTINSYGNLVVGGVEANTISSNTTLSVTGNANVGNLGTSGQLIATGNITTSANIIGNVLANNLDVAGIATVATVDDIKIGGGLNGYYLVTDGTGNLSWMSGGGSGSGVVGGANTQIQFNDGTGSFAGAAGFTFNSVTNIMSTPGNIAATGNISAPYFIGNGSQLTGLSFSTISNGTSNVNIPASGGNINISRGGVANVLVVTGTGANVTGTLNSSGNANVGNLGTGGLIVATGNVAGGNLVTGGALSVTGNANVGNIGGTTGVFTTIAGALTTAAQPNITSVGTLTSLGVSGNTTSNNISSNNYVIVSANSSITAAGTTQGTATQLASSINVVTLVPASSGVKLPVAEAGMRIIVRNSTSTALNVYPNTGAAIEPALVNAPYTLSATTSMEFFCSTGGGSGQWFTLF